MLGSRNKWSMVVVAVVLVGAVPCMGQGFDFGPDADLAAAPAGEDDWAIPLVLKSGLRYARQTGAPERDVYGGALLNGKASWFGRGFKLHGEATGYYNQAYRQEGDPHSVIDQHEVEGVLREGYLTKTIGSATVGVGRKIVVFGRNDLLSLLDIVSPQDSSEALFANPEDTRLGQDLVYADAKIASLNLWLGYAPRAQMNRQPAVGHPYDLLGSDFPEYTADEAEAYGRLSGRGERWEWSLLYGQVHNRDPLVVAVPLPVPGGVGFQKEYRRMAQWGLGVTYTWQPVLLKTELTQIADYPYVDPRTQNLASLTAQGISVGVDYVSDLYGQVMIEARRLQDANREITDQILGKTWYALSYAKSFRNDTLSLSATALVLEATSHRLTRINAAYRVYDELEVTFAATEVAIGQPGFAALAGFDRLEAGIYWYLDLAK